MKAMSLSESMAQLRWHVDPTSTTALAREYARAEDNVLSQERSLTQKSGKDVATVQYTYTTGPNGKRYITGAIVTTRKKLETPDAQTPQNSIAPTASLSSAEEIEIRNLEQTDKEVRAHEEAHRASGGAYASPPTYEYVVGPDGKKYAVAGSVRMSTPTAHTPEEAADYAKRLYSAALAPGSGLSAQDVAVAAKAARTIALHSLRSNEAATSYSKQMDYSKEKAQFDTKNALHPLISALFLDQPEGFTNSGGRFEKVA